MRERKVGVTDRAALIAALKSCYPDARIRVGIGSNETINFFGGLASYRSANYSVEDTLAAICGSNLEDFPDMPDYQDRIVITPQLYVLKASINENQVMPATPDKDGFEHCACRTNPHYDIYYRFDHKGKQLTFALGTKRRTVMLEENTGWSWKLTRRSILCMNSEKLERDFQDVFWNPIAVRIGRKVLGIQSVI